MMSPKKKHKTDYLFCVYNLVVKSIFQSFLIPFKKNSECYLISTKNHIDIK